MFRFTLLVMGACVSVCAHDIITTKITWSREISRLVYNRCIGCHRDGGSAFSLVHYAEARPWAKAIKEETLERRMPPWGAVKGFGEFRGDQGLTQEDLETISAWVEGGAPEGDPALLPKLPRVTAAHAAERPATEVIVDGSLTLKHPVTAIAIEAKTMGDGKSVQVVAERPDGSVIPLVWLYNYNPKFNHPYLFLAPIELPAGSRILCSPAGTGTLSLWLESTAPAVTSAHLPGR